MKSICCLLSGLLLVFTFNLVKTQVSLEKSVMLLMAGADNEGVSIRGGRGKGGKAYEGADQDEKARRETMAEREEIDRSHDTLGGTKRA